jgi:hypothetical protein
LRTPSPRPARRYGGCDGRHLHQRLCWHLPEPDPPGHRRAGPDGAPNGKAIIDEGGSGITVTINGFDISGAVVPDGNGSGIRYEGGPLFLNNDYLHNNQNGLLANADPNGTITINNSEFAFNGAGDGQTHNIYVNQIATLTITDSYIHDASVGHEIKSRAADTIITGSRIFDNSGTASYSIDLPNGGNADIENNVIEQGPNSQNPYIIAYGEEGASNPGTTVTIANNVIVNDLPQSDSRFLFLNRTGVPLTFTNNQVYGLTPVHDRHWIPHPPGTILPCASS